MTQTIKSRYIPEIDGLRGIGLGLVVLFHLFGSGRVSGGVDVFLVVSGFLMTLTIVRRKLRNPSRPGLLREFYARTAMRLVPSLLTVLVGIGLAVWIFLPADMWEPLARSIVASALYMENWLLILGGNTYDAAGRASFLQHIWSLSLQGQILVIWPAIMALVFWLCKRYGWRILPAVTAAASALLLISFGYALWLVSANQINAYFNTGARAWELLAGGLLALLVLQIPAERWQQVTPVRRLLSILGPAGILMILSTGFLLDGAKTFPGWGTWYPVLGTLFTLAWLLLPVPEKPSPLRTLLASLLGTWVARYSYLVYLWHWPILVGYLRLRDWSQVSWRGALLILGISVVLSVLTYQLVAAPTMRLRERWHPRVALGACTAVIVLVAGTAGAAQAHLVQEREQELASIQVPTAEHPGAMALLEGLGLDTEFVEELVPSQQAIFLDKHPLYAQGCIQEFDDAPGNEEVIFCADPLEAQKPTDAPVIVLSGGSHTSHWYPALAQIANEQGWILHVMDKDACRLENPDLVEFYNYNSCRLWNESAYEKLLELKPDYVFTVGTETIPTQMERLKPSQLQRWKDLDAAGIEVIAVRDTPRLKQWVPECLGRHTQDPDRCGRKQEDVFLPESLVRTNPEVPANVTELDLTGSFCVDGFCPVVIGNVIVYRDNSHLTNTYARTLKNPLEIEMREALAQLFLKK